MAVLVSDLVSQIRIMSDLRQNQLFTDQDIIDKINDADRELRDIIKDTNEHYLMTSVDFTLNGGFGIGNDTFTLPSDFVQGHSVDGFPDDVSRQYTVKYLQSWLERNRLKFAFRPKYFLRGKVLTMYPSSRAAGNYRLWYTPKGTKLALKVTRAITITTGDTVLNDGGFIQYILTNGGFDDSYVGASLTVTWAAPNTAWNSTNATITAKAPGNSTTVTTDTQWPGGSFTGPAAGTASVTYQPAGTSDELDVQLDQFSMWHLLHASIAIRNARQQDVTDLDRKLNAPGIGYRAHIVGTVTNRTEEPVQPPMTRRDSFETDIGAWAEWPDAG